MSASTLTNLTQHSADRTPVDVDVKVALDVVRRTLADDGPDAAYRMLVHEHGFLTAIHGPDYHLLPRAAAVLSSVVPS